MYGREVNGRALYCKRSGRWDGGDEHWLSLVIMCKMIINERLDIASRVFTILSIDAIHSASCGRSHQVQLAKPLGPPISVCTRCLTTLLQSIFELS